ncbi:hypothetical protein P4O66_016851 [Electrophorus voltai]|uniref:Uncharacterized protein n=1 Tax=Electrophorus voltai TaxID=2609070 RepID=A0AAD9DPX8_9TELE|nr:hypothetical protein P4O66_016851 [Electrophorus voltai]
MTDPGFIKLKKDLATLHSIGLAEATLVCWATLELWSVMLSGTEMRHLTILCTRTCATHKGLGAAATEQALYISSHVNTVEAPCCLDKGTFLVGPSKIGHRTEPPLTDWALLIDGDKDGTSTHWQQKLTQT